MTHADVEVLTERLGRLERSHRRLKRLSGLVLVAAAAALLSGQAPGRRVLRAEEFVLQDASGTEWGAWGIRQIEPGTAIVELVLRSEHRLATLSAGKAGAHMTLGQEAVSVDLAANRGPVPWSALRMYGNSPDAGVAMLFSPTKMGTHPAILLSPGTEGAAAGISVDSTGALLVSDPAAAGLVMRRVVLQRP